MNQTVGPRISRPFRCSQRANREPEVTDSAPQEPGAKNDSGASGQLNYWRLGWRTPVILVVVCLSLMIGCGKPHPTTDEGRLKRLMDMYATYRLAFPTVKGISAEALNQHLAAGDDLVLVDVRPSEERDVSTLPGAVPIAVVMDNEADYLDRTLVAYCTVGGRSGLHAFRLKRRGFDVLNFEGSILAWTHVGGALIDKQGAPTRRVHVYGERWNLSAEGYEPVVTNDDGAVESL